MINKKKILITGANGLLGKMLVKTLAPENEIHALVRTMPRILIDAGVQYHIIDLSKDWDYAMLPPQIDVIIHLAQSSRFRDFPEGASDVFAVNIASTSKLLEYGRKAGTERFIFASSGGIYDSNSQIMHENSPILPPGRLGYYLGSKLCGEVLVSNYSEYMKTTILRFFFIYGAGQNKFMLIPRLVENIKDGRPITLQGTDGTTLTPTHVKDAAAALVKSLLLKENHVFNISGPEVFSIREISVIIGELLHKRPVFEQKDGIPQNFIPHIDAMIKNLHKPDIFFREGVLDLL